MRSALYSTLNDADTNLSRLRACIDLIDDCELDGDALPAFMTKMDLLVETARTLLGDAEKDLEQCFVALRQPADEPAPAVADRPKAKRPAKGGR